MTKEHNCYPVKRRLPPGCVFYSQIKKPPQWVFVSGGDDVKDEQF